MRRAKPPPKMIESELEKLNARIAKEAIKLLDNIKRLKLERAMKNQTATAKIFAKQGSGIYNSKGQLVGKTKASIDPFLEHTLTLRRQQENEYMRKNGLGIFSDPEYLPYLQREMPELRADFKPTESKVSLATPSILKADATN